MKRNLFLLIASVGAIAIASATVGGCSETDETGEGGSGGTANVGGADCQGCADAAQDPTDPADPYGNVCGYDATADSCEAGSSCEKLEALGDCLCTELPEDSPCTDECDVSCGYCDPTADTCLEVEGGCQTCTLAQCMVEAGACLNDA